MQIAKHSTRTTAPRPRKGTPLALPEDAAISARTMEGAVLRALALTRAFNAEKAPGTKALKRSSKGYLKGHGTAGSRNKVRIKLLRASFAYRDAVLFDVIRFRPKGEADRRIRVEYLPDPENASSVLMRLTPASAAELPRSAIKEDLLSTQQAADLLNVSRPYVTKLVDKGIFKDVVRTAAGHRRIPKAEVERIKAEMKIARRRTLDEIGLLTGERRKRELEDARKHTKTRWVRSGP
jgi:excisionase family DNA binding protein